MSRKKTKPFYEKIRIENIGSEGKALIRINNIVVFMQEQVLYQILLHAKPKKSLVLNTFLMPLPMPEKILRLTTQIILCFCRRHKRYPQQKICNQTRASGCNCH